MTIACQTEAIAHAGAVGQARALRYAAGPLLVSWLAAVGVVSRRRAAKTGPDR